MVFVLGINPGNVLGYHEADVVLVKDGKIIAAINEDRITRTKHQSDFPINSIKEILRITKIPPENIDAIAIPGQSSMDSYLDRVKKFPETRNIFSILSFPLLKSGEKFMKKIMSIFGINAPIYYVPHHMSHAAGSFYSSAFDDAIVFTFDGEGDSESTTVNVGNDGIEKLKGYPTMPSFGHFYARATYTCGFKVDDGEGKTMGLAPYGDPKILYDKFDDYIKVDGTDLDTSFGQIIFDKKVDVDDKKNFAYYRYNRPIKDNPFLPFKETHKREDIAAAAQALLEDKVSKFVSNWVEKTGKSKVCLAGGVTLNVKLNKKIRELKGVEDIFIFPNPGDSGSAAGAALDVCHKLSGERSSERLEAPYFGTGYTNQEIEEEINKFGLKYEKLDNPAKTGAELLAQGKVIGWFQGRLEYGPRALGNRSVIADPRYPETRERINHLLKQRDWFMPFAPSMLDEAKDEYLEDPSESPFMIMAYDAKDRVAKDLGAVTHVDGTVRPQTVKKKANPIYWELIKNVENEIGIPAVLNTSFNRHGVVIVRTPGEALDHLVWGAIDLLIMGDYLVEREFVKI